MKRFFKRTLFLAVFTLFVFCMPVMIKAQGGPGGPGPGNPACDPMCNCFPDGTPCPIDNGVYLLLFIGIGYGIKKLSDKEKTKAEVQI